MFSKDYGEKLWKSEVFLNGINGLHVEITNEDSAHPFFDS
jgi:hypothetical protein